MADHVLKHLWDITVDGTTFEATYNHPFWVTDVDAFVWADQLRPGEHVLLADGQAAAITAVTHHDQVLTVYNLSITDIHTYYVGSLSVLVHNSCVGANGNVVARVAPGSLPPGEEQALLQTMAQIDQGIVPIGKAGKNWGLTFQNSAGDLPTGA